MLPDEVWLSAREVQARIAKRKGKTVMHHATLVRAIRDHGLPAHTNPFGRGYLFFWSEIEEWLGFLPSPSKPPVVHKRGPGRPLKIHR